MVFVSHHSSHNLGILITSAFLFSLLNMHCYADVSIYSLQNNQEIDYGYRACGSEFGGSIDPDGFQGLLTSNDSIDGSGCNASNINPPPNVDNISRWILILRIGNCSVVQKVLNAQNRGYDMVIVSNNESNVEPMHGEDAPEIFIPSVMVSLHAGKILRQNYQYFNNVYLVITDDSSFPFDFNTDLLIPFAVVITVCFVTMISFMVCKCIRDRRRARRHRLPVSSLQQIPIEKFSSKTGRYETCAICLDDYIDGEKLRILPCKHAYHSKCIDPWLTRNRRVCPICKRKVFAGDEVFDDVSDFDSESDDDERSPLVRAETTQSTQSDRVFLLSPGSILSHFGWTQQLPPNISPSTSNYGSSFNNSTISDPENVIQPASIICSINSSEIDSNSNTSINSVQIASTSSLQLQLPSHDYQDEQNKS